MRIFIVSALLALTAFGQTRKTVCASGCDYLNTASGLQTALNDAASAQTATCAPYLIEIDPANVVDLLGTQLTLPAKTCAQYVRVRSSKMSALPADGTRIDPSTQNTSLARIQSTMATPDGFLLASTASAKTRYWALEGLDFYGNSGTDGTHAYTTLLELAATGTTFPSSVDRNLRADHIEVKHSWIHGVIGGRNTGSGIAVSANNVLIADSVIEDIACDPAGPISDCQAVAIGYTDGPIDVLNNVIDGATENSIVGGTFMAAGMLPSFIRFAGNKYSKKGYYKFTTTAADPTWACRPGNVHRNSATSHDWTCSGAAPGTWTDTGGLTTNGPTAVKNIWEVKLGRGYRVFGNDLSGIWTPSGQNAEVFVLNMTTQPTSSNPAWIQPNTIRAQPWTTLSDVYIGGNTIHDAVTVLSLARPGNMDYVCSENPVDAPWCYANTHNNIRFYDNIASGMGDERDFDKGVWNQIGGWLALINSSDFNIDIRHNTYQLSTATAASGQMYYFMAQDYLGLQTGYINFRDNITPLGNHSVAVGGSGYGGVCSFLVGLSAKASYNFGGNIFTTDKASWNGSSYPIVTGAIPTPCTTNFLYPAGTLSAANGGTVVDGSFRAKMGYQASASDGRDSGADVDHVNWATAGASSGALNSALEYKIRSAVTSISGAQRGVTIYFTAPDVNACTWELSFDANGYSSSIPVTSQTRSGRDGVAVWTGLAAGKTYFGRATCDGLKLEQTVDGRRLMFITAP